MSNEKPTLTTESLNPGSGMIGFNKSVSDGVMIHSKRGAETAFTMPACAAINTNLAPSG